MKGAGLVVPGRETGLEPGLPALFQGMDSGFDGGRTVEGNAYAPVSRRPYDRIEAVLGSGKRGAGPGRGCCFETDGLFLRCGGLLTGKGARQEEGGQAGDQVASQPFLGIFNFCPALMLLEQWLRSMISLTVTPNCWLIRKRESPALTV